MSELPKNSFTFLFTDIEGSTKLWEKYPEGMKNALARHDILLRQTIESYGGHVFKRVGDAFCAVFHDTNSSVLSAISIQRELQKETWGEIGSLRVRIALVTGEAELRDGDYFGTPLNRVSRLLSAGHGRQILLSQATCDLIQNQLRDGISLQDLGSHRLKDLQQSVHIYQLKHPELQAEFPPLRSLESFAHNLPIQLTSFIGREKEMEEVKHLISTSRLLTLTGTAGCGKTRLALQAGADMLDNFNDGVWWIELASLTDSALVPQTVISNLGLHEESGRSTIQTITDFLRNRQLLLILDNCEHLMESCARLTATLLQSCPNLHILATSRESLGIAGEISHQIPSLSFPNMRETYSVESLSQFESVQLFLERTKTVMPNYQLTENAIPSIAYICNRLDGIPLAIELAAARMKVLPAEQIATRLDDRFRLLTGGSRTALPRQQTLKATIDWSYNLLSRDEQTLFRRLSVFVGGWSLEEAEVVCSGEDILENEILDLLARLMDKSLVTVEELTDGSKRYRLLETIRQYSRDKLIESGETSSLRDRHLDYYLKLAEKVEPELFGPRQTTWLDILETEHDNLRAAMEWSQGEPKNIELGLRLAGALWRFWDIRGYLQEGLNWLEGILLKSQDDLSSIKAKVLNVAGDLAMRQGNYSRAIELCEQSLTLSKKLDNKRNEAFALYVLGYVAGFQQNPKQTTDLWNKSLTLFREVKDKWGVETVLQNMGRLAIEQGNFDQARSLLEESLSICQEMGDKRDIAWLTFGLGRLARYQKNYEKAIKYTKEALPLFKEINNTRGVIQSLYNLGEIARNQENYNKAISLYKEGILLSGKTKEILLIAACLRGLAGVSIKQKQAEQAVCFLRYEKILRESLFVKLSVVENPIYEKQIIGLRQELGEESFNRIWSEGKSMTQGQVIQCALELATDDVISEKNETPKPLQN